jgi:uncharacterized protein (UPF0548 family)
MFLLRPPTPEHVSRFLEEQRALPLRYPDVGATRGVLPAGYAHDRYSVLLGKGAATFERACAAVDAWKVYPSSWVTPLPADAPPNEGLTYAVLIRHFGFYSLNGCRVVYLVEDHGAVERRGFALGTLPGHEEQGEERFRVSWDAASDEVHYDVVAFSRPRNPLVRLGTPVTRALQRRFSRDTRACMLAAAGAQRP